MRFQYLGTAAAEGWPALFCECEACTEAKRRGGRELRSRSGAIIDGTLLIDLNPDLYMQKLALGLNLADVRDIVITHGHEDHLYPQHLQHLSEVCAKREDPHTVHVYASQLVIDMILKEIGRCESAIQTLEFHACVPGDKVVTSAGYTVTVLKAEHGMTDAQCFMIRKDGKSVLYAHDTEMLLPEAWESLKRDAEGTLDLVSLDCTNGPLPHFYYGHMGFDDNEEFREKLEAEGLAGRGTVYVLNHFSHNGHMLYKEASERMEPKSFLIAYDGMELEL